MLDERKALEKLDDDPLYGKRVHAWVVILSNVNWAAKKCVNHTDSNLAITPFFIEPSTGCHISAIEWNYFGIESVWNEHNYYVNYIFSLYLILFNY